MEITYKYKCGSRRFLGLRLLLLDRGDRLVAAKRTIHQYVNMIDLDKIDG